MGWAMAIPIIAGIGGSVAGSLISSNATDKAVSEQTDAAKYAADLQLQAAREANALSAAQYAQNREDTSAWRGARRPAHSPPALLPSWRR